MALVVGRHVPSGRSVVRTAALRMGRDVAALEFGDLPHLAMEIASVVERSRGRRAAVEVHRAVTALWGHGGAPPAGRSADHAA
ncbi:MAG: hypothetical protein D6705_13140 [Deltaproteobacteria bacterium]|nr:MAG: hypothetical protein D6705_13140 [Deltaproteobacteria bacterium]